MPTPAGAPLPPGLAQNLSRVYLVKGALATTAIEGNTLTEDEVREILDDKRKLPPSQQYLQQEIENILRGLDLIDQSSRAGEAFAVTADWIKTQNRLVLEVEDHVVPGEYTEKKCASRSGTCNGCSGTSRGPTTSTTPCTDAPLTAGLRSDSEHSFCACPRPEPNEERYADSPRSSLTGKTDKTVTRDLNRLRELGLARTQRDRWFATIEQMDAFLPIARS